MKANKAPEKIYLIRNIPTSTSLNTTNDHHDEFLQEWYKGREKDTDIEYTRTDAFVEKACEWLKENFLFDEAGYCRTNIYSTESMIYNFKNTLEGKL